MGGVKETCDNQHLVEKQVSILENRLNQVLVKFSKVMAYRHKLQREIDDLSGERVDFDGIYKGWRKIKEKKKTNQAYKHRDFNQLYIRVIKKLNAKEKKAHLTERIKVQEEQELVHH